MSRKNKSRHRARKARRRARKAEDADYRARNELPPRLRGTPKPGAKPRDGSRWASLTARGGLTIGFSGTGVRVRMDFESPDAEHSLVLAASEMLGTEAGEA